MLPGLPPLPPGDVALLEACKWIYKGENVAEACFRAGARIPGGGQYVGAIDRVRQAATPSNWKYLDFAAKKGYNYGGSLVRRIVFAATTPAVIGSVLVGAAVIGIGGAIYVSTADKPILAGPAMNKPKPEPKAAPGVTYNPDDYFVFLLPEVSGGSVYVGQESQLKEMRGCDMPGGGLCGADTPKLKYVAKSEGFKTYEKATQAWCAELKGKELQHWEVAGDSKANVYGGWYWIGTAPSCEST
jgi:hypothetical protein